MTVTDTYVAQMLSKVVSAVQDDPEINQQKLAFVLTLDDNQLAQVIESVPTNIRLLLWQIIPTDRIWSLLLNLQSDTAKHLVDNLDENAILQLQQFATADITLKLADILPTSLVKSIVEDQDDEIAEDIVEALGYDEDQVGRHINKNVLRIRATATVKSLTAKLNDRAENQPLAVYVLDEKKAFLGYIDLGKLTTYSPEARLGELCQPVATIAHDDTVINASRQIESSAQYTCLPVILNQRIIGAILLSTILWELQESYTADLVNDAPSGEEDLFTPIPTAARMRALWLSVNLATAFLASWVIGWFEGALQEIVALAILMPVVASMGGIAGSQTLAVALRGLALNHLSHANINLLMNKETRIALFNGTIMGFIIGTVVALWFSSIALGAIIGFAILINSLAAALSGTFIPFMLKKINIDPAISGSVILTTVTDVVGFIIFLGLGSFFLL